MQRLACFEDALDRFVADHHDVVDRAGAFGRLDGPTTASIVAEAAAIRSSRGLSLSATARLLANRHGRAHETVRQLLIRNDADARQPIFGEHGALTTRDRRFIWRAAQLGARVGALAERFGKGRPTIHRGLNRERRRRLANLDLVQTGGTGSSPASGIEDVLTHPDVLTGLPIRAASIDALTWLADLADATPPDDTLERTLTEAYNTLRHRAAASIADLPECPTSADLDAVETDLRWATLVKLRLVEMGLPPALRAMEQFLGRVLPAQPADEILAGLRRILAVAADSADRINPAEGQRYSHVCGYAMTRALARGAAPASGRAARRHETGSLTLARPFERLTPWRVGRLHIVTRSVSEERVSVKAECPSFTPPATMRNANYTNCLATMQSAHQGLSGIELSHSRDSSRPHLSAAIERGLHVERTSERFTARTSWIAPVLFAAAVVAALSVSAGEPSADHWKPNTYHPLFTAAERTRSHVQARSFSLADWPFLDGQWEGILCDSDGDVWFSVASHSPRHHAQLFRYDRRRDRIEHVADVGEACGETNTGNPPQDKIHTQMWEDGDVIYCGTCEGHATDTSGYRGGYWLKIDKGTRQLKAMAKSLSGEGLYVMAYDNKRKILYAHTNLNGRLLSFDPATGKEQSLGIPWKGVKARWPRSLNLMVAPDGRVYGSKPGTVIWQYDPATGRIRDLDLKNPQPPDPDSEPSAAERYSESQGLRMTVWDKVDQCFKATIWPPSSLRTTVRSSWKATSEWPNARVWLPVRTAGCTWWRSSTVLRASTRCGLTRCGMCIRSIHALPSSIQKKTVGGDPTT